jgi:Fe-S-cluster-containing hydrogenase component 2
MKKIKIDYSKCTGCRYCEAACSINHIANTTNPKRARIRIICENGRFFPVIAGPTTDAKCNSRSVIVIGNEAYDKCALCRASCPAKPIFREPETGAALKCDFCGEPPNPSCVKWCRTGALELVEV